MLWPVLLLGFGRVLHARQARAAALAGEHAQAALALNAAQTTACAWATN